MDASERRAAAENVAIARVELLYPFAKEQLTELIASYPNLKEIVWVQEEPRNMGAWKVMSRRLPDLLPEGVELGYVGRPTRASPGEGYSVAHAREQERIVAHRPHPRRLTCEKPVPGRLFVWVKRLSWVELAIFAGLIALLAAARVRDGDDGVRLGARAGVHRCSAW